MSSTHPSNKTSTPATDGEHKVSNFLRQIIENDLDKGTYQSRRWAGSPGDAAHQAQGQPDPARIRTRFPPEPNGYLHVGHAKSICLNFGLARDYGGVCHMRFDDTNPEKEDTEYVNSIIDAVKWLGFSWEAHGQQHLYQASDYFDFMYRAAEYLVQAGHAYVDEQTTEQMRLNRGDFGKPGVDSPFRSRTPAENLKRLREMRDGLHEDGSMVLRAKIDMASPNINLRDPAIYRIRRATHHNTGDTWCIYPMYTFAHPIEDALEQITHSFCTLEFEDQRPFYDWLLERLCEGGLLQTPPPRQYEFARLNLTYVITSKRKLAQLVYDHKVSGWDDPRMPTIVGLRRRGYTPESIQLFAERIGVTKSDSWIDYSTLEGCLREDLENKAHRGMAVLDPVRLVLTNWAETFGSDDYTEDCTQPALPHSAIAEGQPEPAPRVFKIGQAVWIEREDFEEVPPKGFKRLTVGGDVRLRGAGIVRCDEVLKDDSGRVVEVRCTLDPESRPGMEGANRKVKGTIHWVSAAHAVEAEIRLYDRLFTVPNPDTEEDGKTYRDYLNSESRRVVTGYVEPSAAQAAPETSFQFERIGYFVADRYDHAPGRPVFNRSVTLRDAWSGKA